jgi:hypothetical protein
MFLISYSMFLIVFLIFNFHSLGLTQIQQFYLFPFRPKENLNFDQSFLADGFSLFFFTRGFTPGYKYFAPTGAKKPTAFHLFF